MALKIEQLHIDDLLIKCKSLENDDRFEMIESIVAGGSVGRGEHDEFSDLDLFVLMRDGTMLPFLGSRLQEFAESLGEIWFMRGPVFVPGFGHSVSVILGSLLSCQFNFNDRSSLVRDPMQGERSVILFDRTGFYASYLAGGAGFRVDPLEVFGRAVNFFWIRSLSVWRDIKRGQLWMAIRHLSDMRDQMLIVKRLINDELPPGLNYLTSSKSVERDLGAEVLRDFEKTLPGYTTEAVIEAFLFCMTMFREDTATYTEVTSSFCEQLRYAEKMETALVMDLNHSGLSK